MPPKLPPRPKKLGFFGRMFHSPNRKLFLTAADEMDKSSRCLDRADRAKNPMVRLEHYSQALKSSYSAVRYLSQTRNTGLYDDAVSGFWGCYRMVENVALETLREFEQDRIRTLTRYKNREAQERSANKTVEELERLDNDYLPDQAEAEYQTMLSNWYAQLEVLRS